MEVSSLPFHSIFFNWCNGGRSPLPHLPRQLLSTQPHPVPYKPTRVSGQSIQLHVEDWRVTNGLMAQSSLSTLPLHNKAFLNKHPVVAFPFSLQLPPADKRTLQPSQIHTLGLLALHPSAVRCLPHQDIHQHQTRPAPTVGYVKNKLY